MHKTLKDNIFVGIQFLIFGIFFLPIENNYQIPDVVKYPGLMIFLTGCIITLMAMIQLNRNLTVFPTPKERAVLYTKGLYNFARHPIYTGVILTFLGLSFFSLSFYKLLISIILIFFFHFKTAYEEKQLEQKFSEYSDYKTKTGKFFPGF